MYKQHLSDNIRGQATSVGRVSDGAAIPFDPDNTDYQQFKKDIQNGVVLNDAEGDPITGDALTTFIGTLP
jgi:hypothetical protein